MNKGIAFFRLVRYPNLLIIAGTMYMFRYVLFPPEFAIDHFLFFLYTLVPVLTAAAGYVINDLMDVKTDSINKPEKMLVGNVFSIAATWAIWCGLFFACTLIAVYLEYIHKLDIVQIFITTTLLLTAYSFWLKKMPLIGNIIIAGFSAVIPVLVIFFTWDSHFKRYETMTDIPGNGTTLIYCYALLAFYSSLIRELVKDMEDIKGDKATRAYTVPVLMGIKGSRIFVLVLLAAIPATFLLLAPDGSSLVYLAWLFGIFFITAIPFLYVFITAKEKKDFHRASLFLKLSMLAGIIAVPFLHHHLS